MGDEKLKFKLKILGREVLKTKFGKINAIKIRPYVQSGRIFEESESVTMWVSDDDNLMPLKIKAGLLVGSLNADLYEYKNLKATSKFTNKIKSHITVGFFLLIFLFRLYQNTYTSSFLRKLSILQYLFRHNVYKM